MAEYKDCLTNEELLKRFKNQFELVRVAIKLAEYEIKSGKDAYGLHDTDNVAYQVLSEIAAGREYIEEDETEEPEADEIEEITPKKSKNKAKASK